jgi:TAG lipase/steryl ester hydrolase/phospholipase A2/LPA acyltransferase
MKDPATGKLSDWSESSHWWIDGSVHSDLPISILSEMFNATHFIVSQVNPHVIPFIPQGDTFTSTDIPQTLHSESRRSYSLSQLAKIEALHRMELLARFPPFTAAMKRLKSVMTQHYYGDINILPEITQEAFPSVLKNPTHDFMVQACLAGERATWPKLGRIRNHCAVEFALDTALRILRSKISIAANALPSIKSIKPKNSDPVHLRHMIVDHRRHSLDHVAKSKAAHRHQVETVAQRKSVYASVHPSHRDPLTPRAIRPPSGTITHVRLLSTAEETKENEYETEAAAQETNTRFPRVRPLESIGESSVSRSRTPSDERDPTSQTPLWPDIHDPNTRSQQPSTLLEPPDGFCDEAEVKASRWGDDPTAPAVTLQALIRAAKTAPSSPEQQYFRRTSDPMTRQVN